MAVDALNFVVPIMRFAHYEVDFSTGELRKGGHRVPLREQSFQVLCALLEHSGQVVTREELRDRLWHGNIFVDFENNLNAIVTRLRQALCDTAEHPRFIQTLPRRGYRFTAPVERVVMAPCQPATSARNPDAYREYIEGRRLMNKAVAESYALARQHLEQAIALDPLYADAYDALAELCWYLGYFGLKPPRRAFSAGIVHALRALELDSGRAETHALLGQFHKIAEYNWDEVGREMQIALLLDPHSAVVRARYAVSSLMPHGRLDEATAELRRSLSLDPLPGKARSWLGIMLVLSRRYEEAIEESLKLLDVEPASWPAYFTIALCHGYLRHREEAIAAMCKAVEFSGGGCGPLGWLGLLLARYGQAAEARAILQQLHIRACTGYVPPTSLAWIHFGLGEIDAAFECMDRAVDECDQFMMPIKTYAFLDPIRSDPRYAALLRKMNLA